MEALKREMEQRGYEILGPITKGWSSDKKFLMSDREGRRLVLRAAAIERCSSMTDLSGRFRFGMSATKTGRAADFYLKSSRYSGHFSPVHTGC